MVNPSSALGFEGIPVLFALGFQIPEIQKFRREWRRFALL
jgi:hypothetical protein